jgi:hypothetical protein
MYITVIQVGMHALHAGKAIYARVATMHACHHQKNSSPRSFPDDLCQLESQCLLGCSKAWQPCVVHA